MSAWVLTAAAAASGAPKATITGGADASGRVYTWTVTNERSSPIVEVVFPHYQAALFSAPDGWKTDSTHLSNVGVANARGLCRARVDVGGAEIVRGGSARFRMQLSSNAVGRGRGVVRVRFADGEVAGITGVAVPVPPAAAKKSVPLIGLGVIALIAVGIRAVFGRRKGRT